MKSKEVTHEDLLAFVAGNIDRETKRRIAAEMKVEGSYVQKWLRRLAEAAGSPFNVRWGQLISSDDVGESQPESEVGAVAPATPAWLHRPLAWTALPIETMVKASGLLASSLGLTLATVRSGSVTPPKPIDIEAALMQGNPLTRSESDLWLHITLIGDVLQLRAGTSAADRFRDFRVEFRQGDRVCVAVAADSVVGVPRRCRAPQA